MPGMPALWVIYPDELAFDETVGPNPSACCGGSHIQPGEIMAVVGGRGAGKTSLCMHMAEAFHKANPSLRTFLLEMPDPRPVSLPDWIERADSIEQVPNNSLLLVDEAGILAAGLTQRERRPLTALITLCRQKGIALLFASLGTVLMDPNVVRFCDVLAVREPSVLQTYLERPGIKKLIERAGDAFAAIAQNDRIEYAFFVGKRTMGLTRTPMPAWFDSSISRMFAAQALARDRPKEETKAKTREPEEETVGTEPILVSNDMREAQNAYVRAHWNDERFQGIAPNDILRVLREECLKLGPEEPHEENPRTSHTYADLKIGAIFIPNEERFQSKDGWAGQVKLQAKGIRFDEYSRFPTLLPSRTYIVVGRDDSTETVWVREFGTATKTAGGPIIQKVGPARVGVISVVDPAAGAAAIQPHMPIHKAGEPFTGSVSTVAAPSAPTPSPAAPSASARRSVGDIVRLKRGLKQGMRIAGFVLTRLHEEWASTGQELQVTEIHKAPSPHLLPWVRVKTIGGAVVGESTTPQQAIGELVSSAVAPPTAAPIPLPVAPTAPPSPVATTAAPTPAAAPTAPPLPEIIRWGPFVIRTDVLHTFRTNIERGIDYGGLQADEEVERSAAVREEFRIEKVFLDTDRSKPQPRVRLESVKRSKDTFIATISMLKAYEDQYAALTPRVGDWVAHRGDLINGAVYGGVQVLPNMTEAGRQNRMVQIRSVTTTSLPRTIYEPVVDTELGSSTISTLRIPPFRVGDQVRFIAGIIAGRRAEEMDPNLKGSVVGSVSASQEWEDFSRTQLSLPVDKIVAVETILGLDYWGVTVSTPSGNIVTNSFFVTLADAKRPDDPTAPSTSPETPSPAAAQEVSEAAQLAPPQAEEETLPRKPFQVSETPIVISPNPVPFSIPKVIATDKGSMLGSEMFTAWLKDYASPTLISPSDGVQMRHADRLFSGFELLKQVFQFPSEETARVYITGWLMRDGSMILKGTPGVGKTTLLTASVALFANPVDWRRQLAEKDDKGEPRLLSREQVYAILNHPRYGPLGQVQLNPDKSADEVLYTTGIGFEEFEPIAQVEKNPLTREEIMAQGHRLTKVTRNVFQPEARSIVLAPIRLFNEFTRANKQVQDAMLGLMAEKQVEFLGQVLPSPRYGQRYGTLTFADYNPHTDWIAQQEVDRALLDRFDLGIFLPTLRVAKMRRALENLFAKPAHRIGQPIDTVVAALQRLVKDAKGDETPEFDPLSYWDLHEIWHDVELVEVGRKELFLANCYAQLFAVSFYHYGEAYATGKPMDVPKDSQSQKADLLDKVKGRDFVDPTVMNYPLQQLQAKLKKDDAVIGKKLDAEKTEPLLNQIVRPLGLRMVQSLIKAAKAYTWLEAAVDGKRGPQKLAVRADTLKLLLPYATDHRVNLGVMGEFQQTFLNFGDFVRHMLIPQYIVPQETKWLKMSEKYFEMTDKVRREADAAAKAERPVKCPWPNVNTAMKEFDDWCARNVPPDYLVDVVQHPVHYLVRTGLKEELSACIT